MKPFFLIGRLVFGGFFVYSGVRHIVYHGMTKEYVKAKEVPLPEAAVVVSAAALIFGGASVLLGVKPKYGAAALIAFLASVSPLMHDFWAVPEKQQMTEFVNFTKNMALLGATLVLLGIKEPWPASLPVRQPGPMEKAVRFASRLAA
jgi:putative oxidoreductase